jgi:hypothetical protein
MKIKIIVLSLFLFLSNLFATTAQELVKKLSLNPASKVIMQWERVFKSERKMKRYKIDSLTDEEKKILKKYLCDHAADSDKPKFAGDI